MRHAVGLSLLLSLAAAACGRSKPAPAPAPIRPTDTASLTLEAGTVIALRAVGPSLIAVNIAEPPAATCKTIVLERHVVDQDRVQVETFERGHPRSKHGAVPGTTYVYRARIGETGAWSGPVTIRTAEPKVAPPPPSQVHARAVDPYAIEITWDADVHAVNGFYLEVKRHGEWLPAAFIHVEARAFTHSLLLPKDARQYRLATFNQHGPSAFVETETVTTPATHLKMESAPPLPACTKLPDIDPAIADLPRADLTVAGGPKLISDPMGGGARHLFGQYRGCMRDMGTFQLQGDVFTLLEPRDDGFPLLRGVQGAGEYAGASVGLYAFKNGRYEEVNVARYCGEPYPEESLDPKEPRVPRVGQASDVTSWGGPFESCQLDFPR